MTEYDLPQRKIATPVGLSAGTILLALLPLILLGLVIAVFLVTNAGLPTGAAPLGELSFERVVLRPNQITMSIVNSGRTELTIAQATVDDALWAFQMEPRATLGRLDRATMTLNYPWVEYEAHEIKLITAEGLIFSYSIPLAVATPEPTPEMFASFALIGIYVGVIPVGLGLLWFPFLRKIGKRAMNFLLSLTIGLLIFLGVDALSEALEIAGRVPGPFQGMGLVTIGVIASFLAIVAVGELTRGRVPDEAAQRLRLAYLIALGIGLHNFGEGLVIGAAYAVGALALGVFLVIGFIVHNVTEGFGIVAPLVRGKPALGHFVALGLLGGAPTILGTWIGGLAYSDLFATLFFAIGAGAIFQVVYEIGKLLGKETHAGASAWNMANVAGLVSGLGIMYVTGLLV
ncbi:MAG: metal transporter [Chloroflexi bacterium]|nr:metal transporter [Chloroflexota bacterium]